MVACTGTYCWTGTPAAAAARAPWMAPISWSRPSWVIGEPGKFSRRPIGMEPSIEVIIAEASSSPEPPVIPESASPANWAMTAPPIGSAINSPSVVSELMATWTTSPASSMSALRRTSRLEDGGRHLVGSRLDGPALDPGVPVGEFGAVDQQLHDGALARGQFDAGERRKRARRTCHAGARQAHVQLHDFASRKASAVAQGHRGTQPVVVPLDVKVRVLEVGVAQAVAERVADRGLAGVVPAVAHEDALAVAHMPVLAREVQGRGGVLEAQRDGLGQAAGGVHRTGDDVGQRAAAGLAAQPGGKHGRHLVGERHLDHSAAHQRDGEVRVGRAHLLEQRQLDGRQLQVGPVKALGFDGAWQAQQEDDGVGPAGNRHGLGKSSVSGAASTANE